MMLEPLSPRGLNVDHAQPHPLVVIDSALAVGDPLGMLRHAGGLTGRLPSTQTRAALMPSSDRCRSPQMRTAEGLVGSWHLATLPIRTDGPHLHAQERGYVGRRPPLNGGIRLHRTMMVQRRSALS